ncbi:hypothetical protein M0805_000617 [Coniferiporia weirii]|nr:hypothetical protein M0805_000617 [Coniferiporia weirii]
MNETLTKKGEDICQQSGNWTPKKKVEDHHASVSLTKKCKAAIIESDSELEYEEDDANSAIASGRIDEDADNDNKDDTDLVDTWAEPQTGINGADDKASGKKLDHTQGSPTPKKIKVEDQGLTHQVPLVKTPSHEHPKNSDYRGDECKAIILSQGYYRTQISTVNAFPSPDLKDQFVKDAWSHGNGEVGNRFHIDGEIIHLIASHLWQMWGQVKTNTRLCIVECYFNNYTTDAKKVAKTVNMLLNCLSFTFQNPELCKGPFKNKIFKQVITETWFKSIMDDGIICDGYVNTTPEKPMIPLPILAIVTTVIECSLEEWKTGVHIDIKFTEPAYAKKYHDALASMMFFQDQTGKTITDIHADILRATLDNVNASISVCHDKLGLTCYLLDDADIAAAKEEYDTSVQGGLHDGAYYSGVI